MALPTSGRIDWAMIQAEFGGAHPINITEYYRGGTYVPDIAANSNVPTTGPISASNFYGAMAYTDPGGTGCDSCPPGTVPDGPNCRNPDTGEIYPCP